MADPNLPGPGAIDPILVEREACRDYARSSKLEWLETNGAGGFAMGTVAGSNTRRYHGLLVASLRPPVERHVLLSKVEEDVLLEGGAFALGAAQYPGVVTPAGFQLLESFRLDPFPTWTYGAGGARVEKRVFLVEGRQTAVLEYEADRACRLRVRPFLAFRDYHRLSHANSALDARVEENRRTISIRPYSGMPRLRLHHSGATFEPNSNWYYNTEYLVELDRGLDFREGLYSPGAFIFELRAGATAWLVATIEEGSFDDGAVRQLGRDRRNRAGKLPKNTLLARLSLAADQFRARRADGKPTIIAGYPWFTDWGRDAMISLAGLLIVRGLLGEARDVVRGFLGCLNQGVIPNRFPDGAEPPEYNTADATLWMFVAVRAWREAGGEARFVRDEFYPAGREIIECHQRGTHHHIGADPADGLLAAGFPGSQLTWMDAKIGDWVVTPRHGKPVEINALWYNALRIMEGWAREFGDAARARAYSGAVRQAKAGFAAFWNEERQCLYDVLAPEGPDPKLRPNQIFAVSLPFPLLKKERQRAVVRAVESRLLTPMGLRTLAPGEPGYQGRCQGSQLSRDGAYHQGTVWPWLLGPFVTAYLRAFGRSKKNVAYCRGLLAGLERNLRENCLGTIGEIFDADPPHRACGAPAQAWSVAEMLRALDELGR
ncbi:MAG TPA: amylo-alpha-1,6-glucosidase [Bryobacterales bacterium]|nr:amylo-alpha-1,6-glucosidase [Bryobacterales bacterium]